MARFRGTFLNSANYEPLIAAPFDARERVDYRKDLITESTWVQKNGAKYIYNGMPVTVCKDLPMYNGLYILLDVNNFNSYDSWIKLANENQIKELQQQIDQMGGGSSSESASAVKKELDEYVTSNDQRVLTIEQLLGTPSTGGILATGLHLRVEKLEEEVKNNSNVIVELVKTVKTHEAILKGIGGENEPTTVLEAIKASAYTLPIATTAALGGILSASDTITDTIVLIATNKIYINPNTGIGEVRQISTDILVNGAEEFILFGGNAG